MSTSPRNSFGRNSTSVSSGCLTVACARCIRTASSSGSASRRSWLRRSTVSSERPCSLVRPWLAWVVCYAWQTALCLSADLAAHGRQRQQGIRRARVAIRHRDHARLGRIRDRVLRHDCTRRIKPIYVSNWFYGGLIIVIAMLHIVNSLAIPVTLTKSYSLFPGAQDAIVQWWYGHNAVGFPADGRVPRHDVLLPAEAGRAPDLELPPIDRRVLGIYLQLYLGRARIICTTTPIPEWVQSLGMVMSLILLAPSWATMINGIMTVSSASEKLTLRSRPEVHRPRARVLRACDVRRADDGDPQRQRHQPLHRVDDRSRAFRRARLECADHVRHVLLHGAEDSPAGRFTAFELANIHFWLALAGVMLYILAMWGAGVSLRDCSGSASTNSVSCASAFTDIMAATGALLSPAPRRRHYISRGHRSHGVQSLPNDRRAEHGSGKTAGCARHLGSIDERNRTAQETGRELGLLIFGILFVSAIGGLVQVLPSLFQESLRTRVAEYASLCPTGARRSRYLYPRRLQRTAIRSRFGSILAEVERYGPYSRAGEFVYDRPFSLGFQANGPGPASSRRQVHGRLARDSFTRSTRGRAELHHAGLSHGSPSEMRMRRRRHRRLSFTRFGR